MQKKITKVELELDAVSGELRVMHDLLNIFANWFNVSAPQCPAAGAAQRTAKELSFGLPSQAVRF